MPGLPLPVSDVLSNLNDQLAGAARIIGRSEHRQAIFRTVYRGSRQVKTIEEIAQAIGISEIHVLKEGGKMAGLLLEKVPNGYKKRKEFAPRYMDILGFAQDRKKLERLPTKISPKTTSKNQRIVVSFPSSAKNAKFITIDDISSFSRITSQSKNGMRSIRERVIKKAFAKIIGESGAFKDWGGEKSDLYSTKLRIAGRRIPAAIAFKGRATTGKLVPAKMGKNGDQINRLFEEPAELFLIVYGGQIDSSIISQMQAFAVGKAMSGGKVYYGVVDGTDLGRIALAYAQHFK